MATATCPTCGSRYHHYQREERGGWMDLSNNPCIMCMELFFDETGLRMDPKLDAPKLEERKAARREMKMEGDYPRTRLR